MKVAVVIPCRNEEKFIFACINSILQQNYRGELMVYACDGLSNDGTQEIIKEIKSSNTNVKLLINQAQSTPHALNLGIKEALKNNCDIIIILGAHSELHESYVQECVNKLETIEDIDCVGGIIENVYENNTSEIIGLAMSSSFGVGNSYFRTGQKEGWVDTVAFGAYKAEVFEKIGFFDEELIRNQDDEFNYRLIHSGKKIFLSKDIRCKYFVRASYKKLFMQYFQYGYWKVYVGKKHRAITTIRQLVPLLFVLCLGLGAVTSLFIPYAGILYLTGLTVYFLTSLYSAITVTKGPGTLKVMYVFFILHLSYGWGYFKGIIDFLILGKKIRQEETLTR